MQWTFILKTHHPYCRQISYLPSKFRGLGVQKKSMVSSVLDSYPSLVQAALNLMDSVSRIGFHGESRHHLWCTTSTESFYTWDWHAACQEDDEGTQFKSFLRVWPICRDKDLTAIIVHELEQWWMLIFLMGKQTDVSNELERRSDPLIDIWTITQEI